MSRGSASTRNKKNQANHARKQLRKMKLKIMIDHSVKTRDRRWSKQRRHQWVDKIRHTEEKETMKFLLMQRVNEDVRAGRGYPDSHLLGIPREVRQQILLHVIPPDVLTDVTNLQLRKFCAILASIHPNVRDEMPYVYKQYERERAELVQTRNRNRIVSSRLITELINPIAENSMPQNKKGSVKFCKLKKQGRVRYQRCWKCGYRHYGNTVVCKPYKKPEDDELGGWGSYIRVSTANQIDKWGADEWLAKLKVDDRLRQG
ncbi:hypothetical protein BU16DRAFT_529201 [Lophium mytilinum]|uniref:Uncharacterized protein n=1 Tax=Lophium mytilinum TaxID=390894 RepID=A0A6A6QLL3_9PEZI|nr:hypothetical protein BU16DRAFT_529201 [Lophium mytilinum]